VPIVVAGATRAWRQWRAATYLMLAISVLTTLIFPIFYLSLIDGDPLAVLLLTARNLLVIALFGWSVRGLVRLLRAATPRVPADGRPLAVRQG